MIDGGVEYYEDILLHVDDCLVISKSLAQSLLQLGKYFMLKEGSVGSPNLCLGPNIFRVDLSNDVRDWAWSPRKYIQVASQNLEIHLK